MSKRVLFITYYWPPSGGAGVQRVLKTVKYLREFGWEPVVYTAKDAAYPVIDESLLADVPENLEVIREPIWEPYELYKAFTGQGKQKRVYSGMMSDEAKPSFTQRASVWIRGNFFIPDARRFWIRPSVKRLTAYLEDNPVDVIYSSGPPHSCHLIARNLKRKFGTPWLADFRDPWTKIDFYDQLMLTRWADGAHRAGEQSVVREADALVTVSQSWAEDWKALGREQVGVVTNGFDEADFAGVRAVRLTEKFTICHTGSLNRDRNNLFLWQTLAEMAEDNADFRQDLLLRFVGKVEENTFRQLTELGLGDKIDRIDYVPHEEAIRLTASARVLLLLLNDTPFVKGIVPGKLYEYLAARRPVLSIGMEAGDAAEILRQTAVGVTCGFTDRAKMKRTLDSMYAAYKAGTDGAVGKPRVIQRYTRRGGAERIAAMLNGLTGQKSETVG